MIWNDLGKTKCVQVDAENPLAPGRICGKIYWGISDTEEAKKLYLEEYPEHIGWKIIAFIPCGCEGYKYNM